MKKLLVAIFAAALVSLGLVGVTSSPAQAFCTPGYAKMCTKTKVDAGSKTVKKGKSVKVPVTVKPKNSNRTPKGTVEVTCKNGKAKVSGSATLKGGSAKVKVGPLKKKGTWTCTVKFIGGKNFKNNSTKTEIKVVKRG